MASSTASPHFLPLPSSKISRTTIPTSFHLSSSSLNPISKLFSISTSINVFEATPSSRFVPRVAFSLDLDLDDDLSIGRDEEQDHRFFPQLKLFVGNLPFNVDNAALARLFEGSGSVEMAEVVYDKLNRRSRGFGFVKMSSSEEAEAAARKFDGYELDGRQLRVNYGPPPRKKSVVREPRIDGRGDNISNTVYVGNLSWSVDDQALETLFWEHGNVMKAKVSHDEDSGRSRGFGFVTYSSADEAYQAVESLDGVDLDGRNIRVSVAKPQQRRQL
ncbi:29 kDa ribonucleoprotein A, chloroplastic-like [Cynara cardunculus var. scolymus]|uniref:29 kDa ribonucleoprotein A, chloroplastic-like n=1 Tax=Cynara cardunculus var. scolymus TaxID=59895 RepID=UPI000D628BB5|nr:29 kDa ribonucleoprotein A, chloroplastic-like [Cynara cardunculus var. scolymus]